MCDNARLTISNVDRSEILTLEKKRKNGKIATRARARVVKSGREKSVISANRECRRENERGACAGGRKNRERERKSSGGRLVGIFK